LIALSESAKLYSNIVELGFYPFGLIEILKELGAY
jgi:hypothetical protein